MLQVPETRYMAQQAGGLIKHHHHLWGVYQAGAERLGPRSVMFWLFLQPGLGEI